MASKAMRYAVWGAGASAVSYIRGGDSSASARHVARAHGFEPDRPAAWAIELDGVDEATIDADTRFDRATVGYAVIPREEG